jgi:hypothetical protein
MARSVIVGSRSTASHKADVRWPFIVEPGNRTINGMRLWFHGGGFVVVRSWFADSIIEAWTECSSDNESVRVGSVGALLTGAPRVA